MGTLYDRHDIYEVKHIAMIKYVWQLSPPRSLIITCPRCGRSPGLSLLPVCSAPRIDIHLNQAERGRYKGVGGGGRYNGGREIAIPISCPGTFLQAPHLLLLLLLAIPTWVYCYTYIEQKKEPIAFNNLFLKEQWHEKFFFGGTKTTLKQVETVWRKIIQFRDNIRAPISKNVVSAEAEFEPFFLLRMNAHPILPGYSCLLGHGCFAQCSVRGHYVNDYRQTQCPSSHQRNGHTVHLLTFIYIYFS